MTMRLSGWQRLWILLTVLWTCAVGILTWTRWPPTYLSTDPDAGVRLAADLPDSVAGIVTANEKITKREFAARVKTRYPVYNDLTDEGLVSLTLQKYPQYKPYILDLDWFEQRTPSADEVNRANTRAAVRGALLLWLLPPVALYALGSSIGWVYRGFRTGPDGAPTR